MKKSLEFILSNIDSILRSEEREETADFLEEQITLFNKAANEGEPLVADGVYDICKEYLQRLRPNSPILSAVWTEDEESIDEDLDKFLIAYPMKSIETIKDLSDKAFQTFCNKIPATGATLHLSLKENGHAGRVVYANGELKKARSRGRSTNGRDLTMQALRILGNQKEMLEAFSLCEIRGEFVLPYSNVEEAKQHNPNIVNAFSGVASMIRESAPEEETRLLHFIAYDILVDEEELVFETLAEKFEFLETCGFITPISGTLDVTRNNIESEIEQALEDLTPDAKDYDYFTDGVVVTINDVQLFKQFGEDEKRPVRLGNLALKVGHWQQNFYNGEVDHISWEPGKTKLTPVAVLQDGVLTASGATVVNVPLYAPKYILMLEAYPGNTIHFKFGGESGVIPCTPDGRLITEK